MNLFPQCTYMLYLRITVVVPLLQIFQPALSAVAYLTVSLRHHCIA